LSATQPAAAPSAAGCRAPARAPHIIRRDLYATRPGLFNLVYGAVGFPTAFTAIVVCGAELFTSMCAYATAAWWEGKINILVCIR
jgi:formate/nitrite transporter FocA (FNT family)